MLQVIIHHPVYIHHYHVHPCTSIYNMYIYTHIYKYIYYIICMYIYI